MSAQKQQQDEMTQKLEVIYGRIVVMNRLVPFLYELDKNDLSLIRWAFNISPKGK